MNYSIMITKALEVGGIYLGLIAVLILIIYLIVKRYKTSDTKVNEMVGSIKECSEHIDHNVTALTSNNVSIIRTISEVSKNILEIEKSLSDIREGYKERLKDIENVQKNIYDKTNENYKSIKEIDLEIRELKHRVELLAVILTPNGRTINKGLGGYND